MAKRSYRGKHPHNDMKVSKHPHGKISKLSKRTAEYNKLKSKLQYDYIQTREGFVPQATAAITGHANIGNNAEITMSAAQGLILHISGTNAASSDYGFKANGNATDAMEGLRDSVNAIGWPYLSASAAKADGVTACATTDCVCTITQIDPGPDGNTTITTAGTWTGSTVPGSFTGG